jgi:hypothetical protein
LNRSLLEIHFSPGNDNASNEHEAEQLRASDRGRFCDSCKR